MLFLGVSASAEEATTPRIQRTNMIVSDLERAFSLYRDVLGFEVFRVAEHGEDSYAYEIFEIDRSATLREAMLSSPTQARVLGLTEVTRVELETAAKPNRVALVVEVENFDETITAVRELGLTVFREDRLTTVDSREIAEQGFLDWDGNLTLVYSYEERP